MAKRVFEVAKDLGVDHRELMKKCDELGIDYRNYMSQIQDDDAQKLKAAVLAGPGGTVEEQESAPGVRRRRRPGEVARTPSTKAEPESTGAKPKPVAKRVGGISAAADATAEKLAAEKRTVKVRPAAEAPVEESKAVSKASKPKVEAKVIQPAATGTTEKSEKAEKPEAEKAAAQKPAQRNQSRSGSVAKILSKPEPVKKPTKESAVILSKPVEPVKVQAPVEPAKILERPTPKVEQKPVQKQETPKVEKPAEAPAPVEVKPAAPVATETKVETKAEVKVETKVEQKPVEAPKAEETVEESKKAAVEEPKKPAIAAPSSFKGMVRKPQAQRPISATKIEEEPKPAQAADGVTRRQPQKPREGAAKILGVIPIEQLRDRTRQAQTRRGPGGRPMGGPGGGSSRPMDAGSRGPGGPMGRSGGFGGDSGASGGPGGFRGPRPMGMGGPRGGVSSMPFPPIAPPADKPGTRRRTVSKSAAAGANAANMGEKPLRGQKSSSSRKRQVSHDELYSTVMEAMPQHHRPPQRRKTKVASRKHSKTLLTKPSAKKRIIRIDETISVGELGREMGVKANELIRKLMQMGTMATVNQQIDFETASLLAQEYEWEVKNIAFQEENVLSSLATESEREQDPDAEWRAPVVTVMGHVDHGKTTLLDRIRKANVASGEAGGITQHIGAYRVETATGPVVFLDTPGHAAFTAMRARGASVTDLVVLVVAADDGVMPQTVESINHARAANVPIIVAINKIDKPGADAERIKQELTKYEIVPEEWGGDVMCVPVSALKSQGVNQLLESLALQAEVLDLKANPKKEGFGTVVEARVDKGRGNVCTVLVQDGTLHTGDFIVSGAHFGRVRAMINDRGKRITEAGPSTPVEVLGLGGLPSAGDTFHVVASERDARRVAETRDDKARSVRQAASKLVHNASELLASLDKQDREKQALILKTDVAGSLEAVRMSLEQLSTDEVEVQIVHAAVGGINESDITLAQASGAVIIGFNTTPDAATRRAATQAEVKIVTYSVIYDLIDGVKELMSGHLAPETVENFLGRAEVRMVFHVAKILVAGCYVTEGKVQRNMMARVHRGKELIAEGKIVTLKRFKDDAREVSFGYECGLSIDTYKDIQEHDTIECYELKQVQRTID